MKRTLWVAVAAFGFLCAQWVPSAFAQAVYGSILGTVTDPSGAAVAGAKVTVTSQTKNTSYTDTTNASGNYSVTHLTPDVYTVHIEGTGFKTIELKNIQVSADTGARVDGQFQVGSTSEQVEVTAEAPQLKTDRADVSIEFNYKEPLKTPPSSTATSLRSSSSLPGHRSPWVEPRGDRKSARRSAILSSTANFSGTAFELDGTDNQDPILGIIVVNPNLDAIQDHRKSRSGTTTPNSAKPSPESSRCRRSPVAMTFTVAATSMIWILSTPPRIHLPANPPRITGSSTAAQSVDRSSRISCSSSETTKERAELRAAVSW